MDIGPSTGLITGCVVESDPYGPGAAGDRYLQVAIHALVQSLTTPNSLLAVDSVRGFEYRVTANNQ